MVRARHILGQNARNQQYTTLNSRAAKQFGRSKLKAKEFLIKHGIDAARLFARIETTEDLQSIDWLTLPSGFAVKPASGSAGKGIVVFTEKNASGTHWIDVNGREWLPADIQLHVSDILSGAYSTWGNRHHALVEERVPIHPALADYCEHGTPDIRIILFRKVPVMAMVRLPTEASQGKANLDQGAIGLGIDIETGLTTFGVVGKKTRLRFFDDQKPVNNIQIPQWKELLTTAVRVANATGLTYLGVDLFLHPQRGPLVAEVNAFPGLSIQIANRAGLRRRLERLEGIEARNVSHAVRIAQALFGNPNLFADSDQEKIAISYKEKVTLIGDKNIEVETIALANPTRLRSVISSKHAQTLGRHEEGDTLWQQTEIGEGKVPVVPIAFRLKNKTVETEMLVSKKLDSKRHGIELGRHDLADFAITTGEENG